MNCPVGCAAEACIFYFTLGKILSNYTYVIPNAIKRVKNCLYTGA
jgi:hypothetical protein